MRRLESLVTWREARQLARDAYRLTMSGSLYRHYAVADQIRRSATSIPANIAEGYGLGTKAQLIRCLRIALGSTYELTTHLELVRDLDIVIDSDADSVLRRGKLVERLLIGLLKSLKAKTPLPSR